MDKAAVPPQKSENTILAQCIEILDGYHANGKNQKKTTVHFNTVYPTLQLQQPRISVWLKKEAEFYASYGSASGQECKNKRIRQTQHPQVTEMLDLWVSKAMVDGILLTGEVLCQKWKSFAIVVGFQTTNILN
jgi:hypothetical protein